MFHALLILGPLGCAAAVGLPDYINACSRSDPNLKECALQSARESVRRFALGDPSSGLEPLDPIYVAEMTVYIPNQQGFRVIFKDNFFKGLSDLQLQNITFDLENKMIITEALVTLDVKNTYDLSGKFLLVPINSNGDSRIILKNTLLHIRFWYDHIEDSEGKIHWKLTKHDIKYGVEKALFRLENLLGDKNIGDQINKVLNEMWREVVAEVGPTICQSLMTAVVDNLDVFLNQVSFEEMFPE